LGKGDAARQLALDLAYWLACAGVLTARQR
jgi:hypothetical protein